MKFDSIDNLPIYNYYKILETGNLALYGVTDKGWEVIEREFFEKIGYDEKFFEILRIKSSMILKKLRLIKTGDVTLKTLIALDKEKLKQLETSGGGNFHETIAMVSKAMGFSIDAKKTSVAQFYGYIKILDK